jgi:hypothetical protein
LLPCADEEQSEVNSIGCDPKWLPDLLAVGLKGFQVGFFTRSKFQSHSLELLERLDDASAELITKQTLLYSDGFADFRKVAIIHY